MTNFNEKLSQSELEGLAQIYETGKFDPAISCRYGIPADWNSQKLQSQLFAYLDSCRQRGEDIPSFATKALMVLAQNGQEQFMCRDVRIKCPLDRRFQGKKWPAKEFAQAVMLEDGIIIHRGVLYRYADEKYRTPDGQRFGGHYEELSLTDLNRLVAAKFPLLVESVGAEAVDKIVRLITLYAPKIEEDLSERRQNLIFTDGVMIDASASGETLTSVGSWFFFSRTLAMTSKEYLTASDEVPKSLKILAELQAGPYSQQWLQCLSEAMGYVIGATGEKIFICLQGAPDSMKTQIVNVVGSCWPMGAVNAQYLDRFNGQFSLESTMHSAFISFADAPSGLVKSTVIALLKQITGGDYVYVALKHRGGFTTKLEQPVLVATNNIVGIEDTAAIRRAVTVNFYQSLSWEQGRELFELIWSERIQIFKYFLRANFARRQEGRFPESFAPLNSYTQMSVGQESWEAYMPRFVINCIVDKEDESIRKDMVFSAFCNLVQPLVGGSHIDESQFYRLFNETFRSIKFNKPNALCEIRHGDWTGKGIKGFALDVSKF